MGDHGRREVDGKALGGSSTGRVVIELYLYMFRTKAAASAKSTSASTIIRAGRHVGRIPKSVPYVVLLACCTALTPYIGSEQMSLVQLFVPTEVAHDTVAELGELSNVQFKDVRETPSLSERLAYKVFS